MFASDLMLKFTGCLCVCTATPAKARSSHLVYRPWAWCKLGRSRLGHKHMARSEGTEAVLRRDTFEFHLCFSCPAAGDCVERWWRVRWRSNWLGSWTMLFRVDSSVGVHGGCYGCGVECLGKKFCGCSDWSWHCSITIHHHPSTTNDLLSFPKVL